MTQDNTPLVRSKSYADDRHHGQQPRPSSQRDRSLAQPSTQQPTGGLWQRFQALSWPQLAVGLSIIAAVVVTSLELIVIANTHYFLQDAFDVPALLEFVYVYFSLFVLGLLFQAGLTYEAYRHKNTMQTIAVAALNVAFFGYSIIQVWQLKALDKCNNRWMDIVSANDPSRWWDTWSAWANGPKGSDGAQCVHVIPDSMDDTTARMAPTLSSDVALANAQDARANLRIAFDVAYGIIGVMTVMAVISVFLAYKVYRAYGWQIFQEQGASLLKKRLLRRVHLFILFLKLNLYFSFGIFVQFCVASVLNHVTKDNGEHMFSTYAKKWLPGVIILGIIGMLYYFCGWYAIEYANRPAMVGFFICILANLGAVLFVLIASSPHGFLEADLLVTTIWLKSFIAVQIFLNVCTLINAIMCWRGFDTGLGDIVSSRRRKEDVEMSTAAEPRPRIELD